METHKLKTWLEPFQAIVEGLKTHEVRRNDRDFKVGDILDLHEWNPETEKFTGRSMRRQITYMSKGPDWGIPEWMAVLSIGPAKESPDGER